MPTFSYGCDGGHTHSEFHATLKPPAEVPCGECELSARRVIAGGNIKDGSERQSAPTPVFGLGFAANRYATRSDRGAWMKKLDQRGW